MNHWSFILAAYALTILGTGALVMESWRSMRRAEADAEKLRRK